MPQRKTQWQWVGGGGVGGIGTQLRGAGAIVAPAIRVASYDKTYTRPLLLYCIILYYITLDYIILYHIISHYIIV